MLGEQNQVIINISDPIPPSNIATIDKDGMLGNAVSKEQFNTSFNSKSAELDFKIAEIQEMVESDFKGTLKPTDASPTVDGSYKPEIYSEDDKPADPNSTADWGKVYPNAGNLRAKSGYDTMFYKKGSVWTRSETKMPEASNKIETWITGFYSTGKQVVNPSDQSIYEANANTISTDVPGISSKWTKKVDGRNVSSQFNPTTAIEAQGGKQIWDAAKEIIEHALEGHASQYEEYGFGLTSNNPIQPSSVTYIVVGNNLFSNIDGKIKKINAHYKGTGVIQFLVVSIVGTSVVIHQNFIKSLVDGNNELDVDIDIKQGQTLAYYLNPGANIYGEDFTSGTIKYFTNQGGVVQYRLGFLDYSFEVEKPEEETITIHQLKQSINTTEKANNLSVHSRITIEGQSNALGVGYSTGLSVSPYNAAAFIWLNEFSRVFIWNPKTNNYENLKVGVNNMSAWDAYYLNPASPTPVPQPTFGPELGIALMWLQTHPVGNLYIDKNVGDGRPIAYFQKGQPYYSEKLERKNKADEWLKERNIKVNEVGFVWVQGENDRAQTKEYYRTQLNALISDRIEDGFIKDTTILIITQIPSSSVGYGLGVYQAKSEFIQANKMAFAVEYPDLYNSDNIHLNTAGQINLGIKSASLFLVSDNLSYADLQTKTYWNK